MKLYVNKTSFFALLFVALSGLFTQSVYAENMKKLGSMNVHYIAIDALFLTPEVAKAYNIERSRYNGLINISVLDNTQEHTPAKTVSLTGTAKNNLGQTKTLAFEKVEEGEAIYYLAQLNYRNEETFTFNIMINDGKEQQAFSFKQTFYVK